MLLAFMWLRNGRLLYICHKSAIVCHLCTYFFHFQCYAFGGLENGLRAVGQLLRAILKCITFAPDFISEWISDYLRGVLELSYK